VTEQPFQGLDSGVSVAVAKLGEGRGSERNLGKGWQPLVQEALEPAQRGSLVTAGSVFARSSQTESASASESPPTSLAAISAA
jgi:hypothetical protein